MLLEDSQVRMQNQKGQNRNAMLPIKKKVIKNQNGKGKRGKKVVGRMQVEGIDDMDDVSVASELKDPIGIQINVMEEFVKSTKKLSSQANIVIGKYDFDKETKDSVKIMDKFLGIISTL